MAGKRKHNSKSTELIAATRMYKRGDEAGNRLTEMGHDPLHALVEVATGRAPTVHPTIEKALAFLEKLIERGDTIAEAKAAADKLISLIKRDLLGYTQQAEVNRINLALMPFAYPELKSTEVEQIETPKYTLMEMTHCPHCRAPLTGDSHSTVGNGGEPALPN